MQHLLSSEMDPASLKRLPSEHAIAQRERNKASQLSRRLQELKLDTTHDVTSTLHYVEQLCFIACKHIIHLLDT